MNKPAFILIFAGLSLFNNFVCQNKPDSAFSDCSRAKIIKLFTEKITGPVMAPEGSGHTDEIGYLKKQTRYCFDKEHHSAWYKIECNVSGNLCFDITPANPKDDYDFMLFRGTYFCDSLYLKKNVPERACISRVDEKRKGLTGLSASAKKNFINEGPGDSYVKPLPVKKGEVFYLVLDNVYDGGDGHSIRLYVSQTVRISGNVLNEKSNPAQAEITLTNSKGDTIVKTQTKKKGEFDFTAIIPSGKDYVLNFFNDSSFSYSRSFNTKDTSGLRRINTVLPKLKKGSKYSIGSINFYPGSPYYLPAAVPAIRNLLKLMQKNDSLKIKIIGHTNGHGSLTKQLSINRAGSIKTYLVSKGIDSKRIETDGKGGFEMLFPAPKNVFEEEQNRRVEILVTGFHNVSD